MSTSMAGTASLEDVLQEYRTRLLEMLRRKLDPALKSRVDAEEVLQEAYIRAVKRWAKRPASMAPFPWLTRIALDCLVDQRRRHRAAGRDVRKEVPRNDWSSAALADSLTSFSKAESRDLREYRVRTVLGALSAGDVGILRLRAEEKLTYPEIAAVLGVNANRAAYLYLRARRHFKEEWRKHFPESEVGR